MLPHPVSFLFPLRWGPLYLLCLGWLGNAILLLSASQVAKIIDMNHWCLTSKEFY
jgi:hypothetical protein